MKFKKLTLVENAHTWHKRWSVWLGSAAAVVTAVLMALPDILRTAYVYLPDDLRTAVSSRYSLGIGVALMIASILAQLVQQRKLNPPKEEEQ